MKSSVNFSSLQKKICKKVPHVKALERGSREGKKFHITVLQATKALKRDEKLFA